MTKQNNQEKFASHNTSGARNLAEFANGENIVDNDVVVWAGITFYHMPRAEDAPHMDAHWSHLKIIPRDLSAKNTLSGSGEDNTAPSISNISNQSTQIGFAVSLNVQASDAEGSSLSYSANGLPSGLNINSTTGRILGNPNILGDFQVQLNVSDGQETSSIQFNWVINDGSSSSDSGGGGPMNPIILFLFGAFIMFKKLFKN